jgi:hypothetical protein
MQNISRLAAVIAIVAGPLAGCGTEAGPTPGYGTEVHADQQAQIVNPNPNLATSPVGVDGTRARDAYNRYATERVYPPTPAIQTLQEGQAAQLPPPPPAGPGN